MAVLVHQAVWVLGLNYRLIKFVYSKDLIFASTYGLTVCSLCSFVADLMSVRLLLSCHG